MGVISPYESLSFLGLRVHEQRRFHLPAQLCKKKGFSGMAAFPLRYYVPRSAVNKVKVGAACEDRQSIVFEDAYCALYPTE